MITVEQLEAQRKLVIKSTMALIDIGLQRGISETRMNFAAGYPSFVSKLRAKHNFQLNILLRAQRNITHLLNDTTNSPVPSFLQDTA